jgi:hypothetical protein
MKREISRTCSYIELDDHVVTFDDLINKLIALKDQWVKPEYTRHVISINEGEGVEIFFQSFGMETDEECAERRAKEIKLDEYFQSQKQAKQQAMDEEEYATYLKLKAKYEK